MLGSFISHLAVIMDEHQQTEIALDKTLIFLSVGLKETPVFPLSSVLTR